MSNDSFKRHHTMRDGASVCMVQGKYTIDGELTHKDKRLVIPGTPSINIVEGQESLTRGDKNQVIVQLYAPPGSDFKTFNLRRAQPDGESYSRLQIYFTIEHFDHFIKEFNAKGLFL